MKIEQLDVIEIANIPNEAARLLFEYVLPEHQNLCEVTNAFSCNLRVLEVRRTSQATQSEQISHTQHESCVATN